MRTISISIDESDFDKFGFVTGNLSFAELVVIVEKELSRQKLEKCINKIRNHGLPDLTMEEITAEVEAVRAERHARNRE
ncbi:hypothetical protein [Spirosoma rhododendri]|uniref:RagB/SusD family nutrient uptake outer membrane protein n=1 Tax=Spirosoma rhododendri TaxID=2728024 RepID=A0A7L5DTS2_9BACT|nr:hypothetical protein [Spirosoma rhododendri]QJD80693.1 RagB/SusD family nutrient uptake outer membrane protein [Spirosoma rhododendri]